MTTPNYYRHRFSTGYYQLWRLALPSVMHDLLRCWWLAGTARDHHLLGGDPILVYQVGVAYARSLRRKQRRLGDIWHVDGYCQVDQPQASTPLTCRYPVFSYGQNIGAAMLDFKLAWRYPSLCLWTSRQSYLWFTGWHLARYKAFAMTRLKSIDFESPASLLT